MGYDVQLTGQLRYISKITDKPSELGQTDLVFGLWSEFISKSVSYPG